MVQHNYPPSGDGGGSFEKYLQSKGLSKATIKHYNMQALGFITWCDMENTDPETTTSTDITAYLKHLQNKGQQNKTRNYQLNILKQFFDWQISVGKREGNPAKHIKIRGTTHKVLYPIFTKQELENIYHHYEVPTEEHAKAKCNWFVNYRLSRQRNKAMLSLMIYQGLCTDEANRLTLKDVQLRQGTVFITGTRKSNERTLQLKPHQIMELMEYQLQVRTELQKLCHPEHSEGTAQQGLYFLPTPAAGQKTITGNDGTNTWKRLSQDIKTSNKKFINFLQVRASVITHWLKQNNLREVQYMAGHRYISSTESYLANEMESMTEDIDKYHPIT